MAKALKSKIIDQLRKLSRWWEEKNKAFLREKVGKDLYKCQECGYNGSRTEMQADHIEPIVPLEGLEPWSWDIYISRMFCDAAGFQILCKNKCHAAKTRQEQVERKRIKDGRKTKAFNKKAIKKD